MKQRKRNYPKKRIISMALVLVMLITLLPMTKLVAFAEETQGESESNLSSSSAILNLESQKPAQFDDMLAAGDVYGQDDNAFLLSEQNELYLYCSTKSGVNGIYYNNLDMTITEQKDGHSWVKSINNTNSGANIVSESSMANIGNGENGFRYVRGTSFDATGNGRREYAAYVGCKDDAVYCFIQEPTTGAFYSTKLKDATWLDSSHYYFEMMNYVAITAGDYDGDGKDSLIVYGCGDGTDINLYEVSFNGSSLESKIIANLKDVLHQTPFLDDNDEIKYKPIVSLTTGDFDGDEIDEFAYSIGFHNTSESKESGWNDKNVTDITTNGVSDMKAFATCVGIGNDTSGWNWSEPMYLLDNLGRQSLSGTTEVYNYQIMHGGSIAAGDIDHNGIDEIVAVGYTDNDAEATFVDGTLSKVKRIGDVNKTQYVTSVIRQAGSGYGRSDLATLDMSTFQKHSMDNYKDKRYVYPQISIACGKTNGANAAEDVFIGGVIYDFKTGSGVPLYTPQLMGQTFNTVMNSSSTYTDVYWVGDVAVGNFNHNDSNREQFVYTVWFKNSSDSRKDRMHTYIGISGGAVYDDTKNNSGEIISLGNCTTYASSPIRSHSGNEIFSNNSNASQLFYDVTDTYANAVPLALDTDNDGLLARLDSMTYLYADPNVNAVLQAAPYFEEIDAAGGYGDSGATSYTIETGYEYATSSGETTSIGAGLEVDAELKVVSIGLELGYNYEYSESFEKAFEETSAATFEAQEQDVVVISRIPVMVHSYDIWNPSESQWVEDGHKIQVPLDPVYFLLSIDEYNDFVDEYNAMINGTEAVKLSKITDTDLPADNEGDPYTYYSSWSAAGENGKQLSKQGYSLGYAGGAMGSEWSTSASETESKERGDGIHFHFSLMFGGEIDSGVELWGGAYFDLDKMWSSGSSKTTTSANGSSGTVQNINESNLIDAGILTPEQVREYGFMWEFGKWTRPLQGTGSEIPFYGYRVYNIKSLAKPVTDLGASFNTDESGELYIDLSWTEPESTNKPIGSYTIYLYQADGSKTKIVDLPAGTTGYTYEIPDGRTEYAFVITTKGINSSVEGIESNKAYLYQANKSIFTIIKTSTNGAVDTYTITYTDGTTSTFDVTNGVGIQDVECVTSADGLTITYTTYFSDGSSTTFSVRSGADGADGEDGKDGEDGREVMLQVIDGTIQWKYDGESDEQWRNLLTLDGNNVTIEGLEGDDGEDGREVEIQMNGSVVQWRYIGEENWTDLYSVPSAEELKGEQGNDGREVEISVNGNILQWHYVGEENWTDLYTIPSTEELKGEQGDDGREIEISVNGNILQWHYVDEENWTDLYTIPSTEELKGVDGREIEIAMNGNLVQWRYVGDENWTDLYQVPSVEELKGAAGSDGVDGREVLLQVVDGMIQWQHEGDSEWTNLLQVEGSNIIIEGNGKNGEDGKDGRGIVSIDLTSSQDNIDTYTITYTDGTTSNFTITNGKDGRDGANGKDGAAGKDGIIIYHDNNNTATNNSDSSPDNTHDIIGNNAINGANDTVGSTIDDSANSINYTDKKNTESNNGSVTGSNEFSNSDSSNVVVNTYNNTYSNSTTQPTNGSNNNEMSGTNNTSNAQPPADNSNNNELERVGISDITVNENGDLVFTMSDGTEINAGSIVENETVKAMIQEQSGNRKISLKSFLNGWF